MSSLAGLIYQVSVMDMLFTYYIRTSHTSSVVIGVFLLGLGLGSYLIHASSELIGSKKVLLRWLQFLIALYAVLFFYNLYSIIPDVGIISLVALSVFLLLIPTMALGATFAIVGYLDDNGTGFVYALDLLGAVIGSLLSGFVLIPSIGVQLSVLVAAFASALGGLILVDSYLEAVFGFVVTALVVSLFMAQMWSGAGGPSIDDQLPGANNIIDQPISIDTRYGTIELSRDWLFINKVPQCSFNVTYTRGKSERWLADLSLSGVNATRVANIGLGCGATLDRIQETTDALVDVIEINPAVIDITEQRTDLLSDDDTRVIQDDGYQFMRDSSKQYDSVIIDVPNPTIAYSSNLYTKEMFEAVKDKLSDEGTLGLWVPPCYDGRESDELYGILQNTLSTTFRYTYKKNPVVIASDKPLQVNATRFDASPDSRVNTVDRQVLEDFYSDECTWRRQKRFRENYPFIYNTSGFPTSI